MPLRRRLFSVSSPDGMIVCEANEEPSGSISSWIKIGAGIMEVPADRLSEFIDLLIDLDTNISLMELGRWEEVK